MTQKYVKTLDPQSDDGSDLASELNEFTAAEKTGQSGASRPPGIGAGGAWTRNNGDGTFTRMIYTGAADMPIGEPTIQVSANDTTPGTLEEKLIVGDGLSLETTDEGGAEKRRVELDRDAAPAILGLPPGAVQHFALVTAPTGWLIADGSDVSRVTYAALFAAVGTLFGGGDGSTTFTLPDLRGEFIRGLDQGRGVDQGRALGAAQGDNLPEHNHKWYEYNPLSGGRFDRHDGNHYAFDSAGNNVTPSDSQSWDVQLFTKGPENVQGETRPRNIALLACIKT